MHACIASLRVARKPNRRTIHDRTVPRWAVAVDLPSQINVGTFVTKKNPLKVFTYPFHSPAAIWRNIRSVPQNGPKLALQARGSL